MLSFPRVFAASNTARVFAVAAAIVLACSPGDKATDGQPSEPIAVQRAALVTCDLSAPFGPVEPAFTGVTIANGITFSQDGLTAYVSAKLGTSSNYDVYVATRASTEVEFAASLTKVNSLSSDVDDRVGSLSLDGSTFFLAKIGTDWKYDLAAATFNTSTEEFDAPQLLGPLNTALNEQDPFFLPINGGQLYFSAETPPTDIRELYVSPASNGYSTKQMLFSHPAEDWRPVLTADAQRLYFASTRGTIARDGEGDVWTTTWNPATGAFDDPADLYVFSSPKADYPVALADGGCTLYIASNRHTRNEADYQLYRATRGSSTPPNVTTSVRILGTGSVITAPFECSTNCSAQGAPGSQLHIFATSQALWSGACVPDGNNPSSDGFVIFSEGGVCTVDLRGVCGSGRNIPRDDDNPCTTDTCDPAEGVFHEALVGTACTTSAGTPGTCSAFGVCVSDSGSTGGAGGAGGTGGGGGSSGGGTNCANSVKDGDETDVDCGGSCPGCPAGHECEDVSDCAVDLDCGTNNGACFDKARAKRVCWPLTCSVGLTQGQCGEADSPCGQNCACVNPCNVGDPTSSCPEGELCKPDLGFVLGGSSRDACADPRCPSNDPEFCGGSDSLCGNCLCTPDCSTATCQDPDDGCDGFCPAVCDIGDTTVGHVPCPLGAIALPMPNGTLQCRPAICGRKSLVSPLCGSPGAPCGDECPACVPQCGDQQCGLDPNCGQPCGTCGDGTYCNAAGQCVASSSDAPPQVPCGSGTTCGVEPLPSPPASPVGPVPGQFSVSEHGTAQYRVPIVVPPGRAGLEPALSLTYAGTRSSADSGVGWQLEGLSTISRCPRTYAIDGYAAPIQNTNDDALCIDGKRMVKLASPAPDGGTEYRTIIDSFARIIAYKAPGGSVLGLTPASGVATVDPALQGPDYFKVWAKDGRIITYGATLDSLVVSRDGVRRSWLVNRVEDRSQNNIIFTYESLPSTLPQDLGGTFPVITRPKAISYTGHGATAGNREVRFTYELRPDPSLRFLQGGIARLTEQRLSNITTYVDNQPVRNYSLKYKAQEVSQVESIFECAGNGDPLSPSSRCKPPTRFEYVEESGFEPGYTGERAYLGVKLDANGDGISDFMTTTVTVDGVPANPALASAVVTTDVAVGVGAIVVSLSSGGVGAAIVAAYELLRPLFFLGQEQPDIDVSHRLFVGNGLRGIDPIDQHPVQVSDKLLERPNYFFDYDRDGRDDWVAYSWNNLSINPLPNHPLSYDLALAIRLSSSSVGTFTDWTRIPLPWEPSNTVAPPPIVYDVDGDSLQDIVSCRDSFTLELRRRKTPTTDIFDAPVTLGPMGPAGTQGIPHA